MKKFIIVLLSLLFVVCGIDQITEPTNNPPVISGITASTTNAELGEKVTIKAEAADPDGDDLEYSWESSAGTLSSTAGDSVTWTAPSVPDTSTIKLTVYDGSDTSSDSISIITGEIQDPSGTPATPAAPEGPTSGFLGESVDFTASSTDSEGDDIKFEFEWGDGSANDITELFPSGTEVTASHSYSEAGTNTVKVRAIDENDSTSVWSEGHDITITANDGAAGTMTDIDGNEYATVKIGAQEWMAENLKVTKYSNGDPIPTGLSDSEWNSTSEGAYAAYNNDEALAEIYGYLYNWSAIDDPNDLAPEGWHVPTDEEWKELEMYLGMSQAESDEELNRGTNEGDKLKEAGADNWSNSNTEPTNESGFTALPGGVRTGDGDKFLGDNAYFWSATEDISLGPWARALQDSESGILRYIFSEISGMSVRLVKGEAPTNQPPIASIEAPADGATYTEVSNVTFTGSATDPEDGSLTGYSLVWTSDKDGGLGTGTTFSTSGLSVNTHIITLTAIDSDVATSTASITITVTTSSAGETGTMEDIDGNEYNTVKIGDQVWMAENLRVTKYSNGDPIPTGLSDAEWSSTSEGAYAAYNDDEALAEIYGYLYNWFAIDDPNNLAPEGWHIPTDDELKELEIALGMSQAVAAAGGERGTDEGGKLKEAGTSHWNSPNTGATNESGFEALPAGSKTDEFGDLGDSAFIWTATEATSDLSAWYRLLTAISSAVSRSESDKNSGFSVRLVKGDAPTNQPPNASIHYPASGAEFELGSSVVFAGSATDAEDVSLAGSSLVWISDKDGQIGTGTTFTTSILSVNSHLITLTATDSYGATDTTSIALTVSMPNQSPTASILDPIDGAYYSESVSVTFSGSATDPEDGSLTGISLAWTSDKDGLIGAGETFTTNNLSVNTHVITLTAIDSDLATSTASVTITVKSSSGVEIGTMTDQEGNVYSTMKIGELEWMTENFKATKYSNGESITSGLSELEWSNTTEGAYAAYNDDETLAGVYGYLYNYYAIVDANELAPVGWHLPTDEEWKAIEMLLGMSQEEADADAERGTDEGGKLKEAGISHWNSPNTGATNESGFTAIPGGTRSSNADGFFYLGEGAYFWTATDNASGPWARILNFISALINRINADKNSGYSIRFVKNTGNEQPTASIEAPADGATFVEGASVTITGSATDAEDGELTGASLVWTSDKDGEIGTGATFTTDSLSLNTHVISLTATDSEGATNVATITITVTDGTVNELPVASIDAPANSATFSENASVTFTGSATDAEDGALMGASLVWSSNKDGSIGTGTSFTTDSLSVNAHVISLTATDGDGATNVATITITITAAANQPPIASIQAPSDSATFVTGVNVTFAGSATDPEDGSLTGSSLVWKSDIDGLLGSGETISTNSLSVNTHVISLTATDGDGAADTTSITITVTAGVNQPPTALIEAPADGATVIYTESVTFTGSATDPEDGILTGSSLVWNSNKSGEIGTGTSFSTSTLSLNTHIITLTAADSDGATDIATITIIVSLTPANQPPVASIDAPVDGETYSEIADVTFTGSATDGEDGSLTDTSLVWLSDIDGSLGTGTTFTTDSLSVNTHVISLTATDSEGATNVASITITIRDAINGDTGTMTDIDENVYNTVMIGNQEWMSENLKVTQFRNGDAITNVTSNAAWTNLTTSAYAAYDNVESNADSLGYLYNWYTVSDAMNLAPEGWHVPTDDEWKEMEMYLGMSSAEANADSIRGTDEGNKLKADTWGSGTNESGFSALPGGQRDSNGNYNNLSGSVGLFWSSSEWLFSFPWYRILNNDPGVGRYYYTSKNNGLSIRLVKDQ